MEPKSVQAFTEPPREQEAGDILKEAIGVSSAELELWGTAGQNIWFLQLNCKGRKDRGGI